MKRLAFFAMIFLCLFLFSGNALSAAQIEKGPYMLYPGTNSQMTILWQLDSTTTCTLAWGTDTTYSTGSTVTSEYGSDHQHKYNITGLTAATKYYYRVNVSSTYYTGTFYTAPLDTVTDIKFLAYGDTRSYPADHDAVCSRMINTYTNDSGYQTMALHVGDWVNYGDTESDWTGQFFDRSYTNTTQFQANIPIMGCMGNHEYTGALYTKYWPYPFVNDRYFSYDYGPVHVIIVDQYVSFSPGSTQYTWLENDLSNSTKDWKIIVLHEPGWSAGGHSNWTDVQNYIHPLCLQYGVDIVFAGHNHYYARCDVDGIQHVTTGGGGAPLYAPSSSADNLVTATEVHHFCELEIANGLLTCVARDRNGNVIDSFTQDNTVTSPLPFTDGFESGDLTTGGWVIASKVKATSTTSYNGNYSAELGRAASITKSAHTIGKTSIHVKYARKTVGLDAGEYLIVEWYDGTNWNELERTQDTAWVYKDFTLPSGADGNASFKIRFINDGVDNKEFTYVDDVEISGT
jgi:predicted phosphodiesterase